MKYKVIVPLRHYELYSEIEESDLIEDETIEGMLEAGQIELVVEPTFTELEVEHGD